MTDHLNYFEPYQRREAHHEDQLTRAFLIILRHVPMAHAAWLALVDQGHRQNDGTGVPHLHELPEPDFYTQVRDLPDEVVRLVSVIQTDEPTPTRKTGLPQTATKFSTALSPTSRTSPS